MSDEITTSQLNGSHAILVIGYAVILLLIDQQNGPILAFSLAIGIPTITAVAIFLARWLRRVNESNEAKSKETATPVTESTGMNLLNRFGELVVSLINVENSAIVYGEGRTIDWKDTDGRSLTALELNEYTIPNYVKVTQTTCSKCDEIRVSFIRFEKINHRTPVDGVTTRAFVYSTDAGQGELDTVIRLVAEYIDEVNALKHKAIAKHNLRNEVKKLIDTKRMRIDENKMVIGINIADDLMTVLPGLKTEEFSSWVSRYNFVNFTLTPYHNVCAGIPLVQDDAIRSIDDIKIQLDSVIAEADLMKKELAAKYAENYGGSIAIYRTRTDSKSGESCEQRYTLQKTLDGKPAFEVVDGCLVFQELDGTRINRINLGTTDRMVFVDGTQIANPGNILAAMTGKPVVTKQIQRIGL
jgi:hypothetical protein